MTPWNYQHYTTEWLKRAQRNRIVDKGDKFISLFIAFDGWMKGEFGEGENEGTLIKKVKKLENFESVFKSLKSNDRVFKENLNELKKYDVINMKFSYDARKNKKYNGRFESLIGVIYQIRCNLFHGRKNATEYKTDYKLICLAYDILLPLFKRYLEEYENM